MPHFLSSAASEKCHSMRTLALACIVLTVITLAVYMKARDHEFINYDDDVYVTSNPHVANGLSLQNFSWAFRSVEAGNWHPITWLSQMVDVQLYGINPRGHHLTNVAIHTISSLLLLLLLFRLTGAVWQSSFVAVLFALHPLHVESVAWVAERKDLLSAFFGFLTLLIYAEFTAKRKSILYFLCLFSFILGLMSKPMLVTLPLVMLLIDFWPLDRYRYQAQARGPHQYIVRVIDLVREKIPFYICSLLSGAITIYAQHKSGAMSSLDQISFQLRIENALIAYVKYIGKTLWPHDLAVLYPFPLSIPPWQVISSLFILLLLSMVAIRGRRRHPYFAVGWFWFFVTLVPVVGLIQVGSQSMADRYSYIPVIGLFIMAAWGVPNLTKGLQQRQLILGLFSGAIIIASAALTWQQLDYWRDSISLYQHTLRVTTGNTFIHYNLGLALASKGDLDAAIQEYKEALRLDPNNSMAHNNLGQALAIKGNLDAAIQEYNKSLWLDPKNGMAHSNLGASLAIKGDLDAAIQECREALRLDPSNAMAHFNLGHALAIKGDLNAAILEYREGLQMYPDNAMAQNYLRLALAQKRMQDPIK